MNRSRRDALHVAGVVSLSLAGCLGHIRSDRTDEEQSEVEFVGRSADGDEEVSLVDDEEMSAEATTDIDGEPMVSIELTSDGADEFVAGLDEIGALDEPVEHLIVLYYDGEAVYEGAIAPDLAAAMRDGSWDESSAIPVHADSEEHARELRDAIEE